MKIREITEGIFDFLKSPQSDMLSKLAQGGAAAWKIWQQTLQGLEKKNDFKPLSPQQMEPYLRQFIDRNVIDLDKASPTIKTAVTGAIRRMVNAPDNRNLYQTEFAKMYGEVQRSMPSMGGGGGSNVKFTAGGKQCKDETSIDRSGTIKICGQELRPNDPAYKKVKDMIDKQNA